MAQNRRTFKDFHKNYGLYLFRAPHELYTLADFGEVENRFWLEVQNESIVDELDFEADVRKRYRTYLNNAPFVKSNLPDITLEKEFSANLNVAIPTSKIKPGLGVNNKKILNFQFGDIKARVLENTNEMEIRRDIEKKIEEMDRREVRRELGRPGKTYIVEELYYADQVKITIEKNFGLDAEVEAGIKNVADVEFKVGLDSKSNHEYTFKGDFDVPFAAKIISLKDL